MTTSGFIKATKEEKSAHDGLYDLYGFVCVDGYSCVVEDKRPMFSNDELFLDVLAPKGMFFLGTGSITLGCDSLDDVKARTMFQSLEFIDPEKNPEFS